MDEICDRCATQNCGNCEAGRGSLSTRVKAEIARRLTNFLLSDKQMPDEVVIYVQYAGSTAKLNLGLEGIKKLRAADAE